jgi:hypothetical protein
MQHPFSRIHVETGNAGLLDTSGTGWFIGFSEWAKSGDGNLRHVAAEALSSDLCVKWFNHPAGHPNGEHKPISEGRTISILVGAPSDFRIECSTSGAFEPHETVVGLLRQTGDYMIWGEGVFHRAFGIKPATILTIRWKPRTSGPGAASNGASQAAPRE